MQSSNTTYISAAYLSHTDQIYDITQMLNTVTVNEDIFNMFLMGEVEIVDVNNHLEEWQITDETWKFTFTFYCTKIGYETSLTFSVYSIQDIKKESDTKMSYKLMICSPEMLANMNIRISKGYSGTKTAILSDIINRLKTTKPLLINADKNNSNLLVPKLHPTDAIDLLLLYNETTPDYVFWESFKGFNCKSITKMLMSDPAYKIYERNRDMADDKELLKNPNLMGSPEIIINYSIPTTIDVLSAMNDGYQGATLFVYDPLVGNNTKYKINDSYAENAHYIFHDNSLNYANYLQRHKILSQIDANQWNITTVGDFTRCAGDTVYISLLNSNQTPGIKSSYSGVFIITAIKHVFQKTSYIQNLKVSR